jgi:hypothetical protein
MKYSLHFSILCPDYTVYSNVELELYTIENLHVRQIFDLGKKSKFP